MSDPDHWESVYARKQPDEVSWYTPHLEQSLAFIRGAALPADARIVDVGGGASTLVDDLLALGHVLVATFAPDGHERCSGLPVARYSADAIHAVVGTPFTRLGHATETHATPWGSTQSFVYCFCRRA